MNVLTSEFFADFTIFDFNDTLTQIDSFTGLSGGGGFTLRGFSSSAQLRDGFYRIGRYGTSKVDRIEIIKGSNAAIYGRTSSGGMINMISKEPRAQPGYKFTFNTGSYSTMRGVFEATGPVVASSLGKTSFLLASSQANRADDSAYARSTRPTPNRSRRSNARSPAESKPACARPARRTFSTAAKPMRAANFYLMTGPP